MNLSTGAYKLEISSYAALTLITLKMESHSIDLVIRGHHIDTLAAPSGAILCCERESFNPSDPYAVATLNKSCKNCAMHHSCKHVAIA